MIIRNPRVRSALAALAVICLMGLAFGLALAQFDGHFAAADARMVGHAVAAILTGLFIAGAVIGRAVYLMRRGAGSKTGDGTAEEGGAYQGFDDEVLGAPPQH